MDHHLRDTQVVHLRKDIRHIKAHHLCKDIQVTWEVRHFNKVIQEGHHKITLVYLHKIILADFLLKAILVDFLLKAILVCKLEVRHLKAIRHKVYKVIQVYRISLTVDLHLKVI